MDAKFCINIFLVQNCVTFTQRSSFIYCFASNLLFLSQDFAVVKKLYFERIGVVFAEITLADLLALFSTRTWILSGFHYAPERCEATFFRG